MYIGAAGFFCNIGPTGSGIVGFTVKAHDRADKRSSVLGLTADGYQAIGSINEQIDIGFVRPAHSGEVALYNGMFRIVMDHMHQRSKR